MNRFALPVFMVVTALIFGVMIGRYTAPAGKAHVPTAVAREAEIPRLPLRAGSVVLPPSAGEKRADHSDSEPSDIVAGIKAAMSRVGTRHNYAAFSKLVESVDEKNIAQAISFTESLPKDEKGTMLLSLLVGRWAEFDPQNALNYAQRTPFGPSRNSLLGSAISGWAEHDLTAATAWTQQLPPGPLRDQALQTIVFSLADKDPRGRHCVRAKFAHRAQSSE